MAGNTNYRSLKTMLFCFIKVNYWKRSNPEKI